MERTLALLRTVIYFWGKLELYRLREEVTDFSSC